MKHFRHSLVATLMTMGMVGCASLPDSQTSREVNPYSDKVLPGDNKNAAIRHKANPFPGGEKELVSSSPQRSGAKPCEGNSFLLHELRVVNIGLSNRDVASSGALLKLMGYQVLDAERDGRQQVECNALPVVVMPGVPSEKSIVHDEGVAARGGIVTGDLKVRPLRPANTVDMDHLLVFYHEEQKDRLSRLRNLIHSNVDVPSPQVYIETLVLEVSEEDSKELGVSYENANVGTGSLLNLGALEVNSGDTATFSRSTRSEDGITLTTPGAGIDLKIRALVDEGRAEILSRPSVLALSNRQAVIQIVDVVQTPILKSTLNQSGDIVISSYSFEPLLLGITLNLRPRVSADRSWVSLEIDATVEAEVDENSGTAFAPDPAGGRIALAEKKGSSSRKVRTFARIPDRTPIIIGGLVAGTKEKQTSRVPVLGAIPVFGALFGATDNEVQKREVIIVLTPHIMAEDAIGIASNRASDTVLSRLNDLQLFQNEYEVQHADVFDMNFLMDNQRFQSYRDRALAFFDNQQPLAPEHPARQFVNGRIPGERALIDKMLFDIVSNPSNRVVSDPEYIFLPEQTPGKGRRYMSLATVLDKIDFDESDTKGLWLEFVSDPAGDFIRHRAIARPDHESWSVTRLRLEEMSTDNAVALLITSEADKERLMRSVAVDTLVRLNGGLQTITLQSLKGGTVLKLGTTADHRNYKLSSRTAGIFVASVDYFDILQRELSRSYEAIDAAF